MGKGNGGGALEFVEGLMGVVCGEALVKGGRAFLSTCLFVVGDGSHILFWPGKWVGDNSLKTLSSVICVFSQ